MADQPTSIKGLATTPAPAAKPAPAAVAKPDPKPAPKPDPKPAPKADSKGKDEPDEPDADELARREQRERYLLAWPLDDIEVR